jgi:hypothetical protein
VGGVLFFLTVMVVLLGVTTGLLVRRVKTKQLSDVKSKSPKQTPSGTSTCTVDWEIFVVKNFSSTIFSDEN